MRYLLSEYKRRDGAVKGTEPIKSYLLMAGDSSMKTVILTPDLVGPIANGGIGTFCTNLSFLLRDLGDEVTIVFTGETSFPRSEWESQYAERGITVIDVHSKLDTRRAVGNQWFIQHSEAARQAIPDDTDIIYTQDWRGNAFQFLRHRQFSSDKQPIVVTVVHSPSAWLRDGMQVFANEPVDDLALDFVEQYAATNSDYLVAPSHYMLEWIYDLGWQLPPNQVCKIIPYPFFPTVESPLHRALTNGTHERSLTRKLIFFGRLETRKGIELFVETLQYLSDDLNFPLSNYFDEIVLLGKHEGKHKWLELSLLCDAIAAASGLKVLPLTELSTYEAQAYLRLEAKDSLVVMPSLVDNLPFTVIEASLISHLNLLTTTNGGMQEILGQAAHDRLFEPFVKPFAKKLIQYVSHQPPLSNMHGYDWPAANNKWIAFHESLSTRRTTHALPQPSVSGVMLTVDICIPHHNHGRYLPQLLHALTHQSYQDFGVILIDDASTDPFSCNTFHELSSRYSAKGWRFIKNAENQGLSQTRNIAAQNSTADYVIFMDADNIPAPTMVEKMVSAMINSEADCLSCYAIAFRGDDPPYKVGHKWNQAQAINNAYYRYLPLGATSVLGLFTNSFGDANIIIKRTVLEAIGGFSLDKAEYRHIAGEDHALLAKITLCGFQFDVIPQYLFYYRFRDDSMFRTTSHYANTKRVQQVYRERLKEVGLEQLIPITYGLYERALEHPSLATYHDPNWVAHRIPWRNLLQAMFIKVKKHLPL